MEQFCLDCGERIYGRSDKKFCSDACRSAYHNAKNRDHSSLMRQVHRTLRKNLRILKRLNTHNKTKVPKTILMDHGFAFDMLTQIYTAQTGQVYRYVYDQGYLELGNDLYLLVKKKG